MYYEKFTKCIGISINSSSIVIGIIIHITFLKICKIQTIWSGSLKKNSRYLGSKIERRGRKRDV